MRDSDRLRFKKRGPHLYRFPGQTSVGAFGSRQARVVLAAPSITLAPGRRRRPSVTTLPSQSRRSSLCGGPKSDKPPVLGAHHPEDSNSSVHQQQHSMAHLSLLTARAGAGLAAGAPAHFALFEAIRHGRFRQAELLVEGGAAVNGRSERGETALIASCVQVEDARTRARFTRLLLDNNADPNGRDARNMTALMHACMLGLGEVVLVLLSDESTDISLQDSLGNTALMYASAFGHDDIIQLLLTANTRVSPMILVNQSNFLGHTAMDQAVRNNHGKVIAMLAHFDTALAQPLPPPKAPYNTPLSTPEKQDDVNEPHTSGDNSAIPSKNEPEITVTEAMDETTQETTFPGVTLDTIADRQDVRKGKAGTLMSKDVRAVLHQEQQAQPTSRPPTPIRPRLPSLRRHTHAVVDLNASQTSTRSEPAYLSERPHMIVHRQSLGLPMTVIPRSQSEPRTLFQPVAEPAHSDDDDDSEEFEEVVIDLLNASTKSEPGMLAAGTRISGPKIGADKAPVGLHLPPIRSVPPVVQRTLQNPKAVQESANLHVDYKPVRRKSLKRRNEDEIKVKSPQQPTALKIE